MGIFKWTFFGPKPLKIISLGLDYFQKLFFEIFLPLFVHFRWFTKLKILRFFWTFWPISKQTADVKKIFDRIN